MKKNQKKAVTPLKDETGIEHELGYTFTIDLKLRQSLNQLIQDDYLFLQPCFNTLHTELWVLFEEYGWVKDWPTQKELNKNLKILKEMNIWLFNNHNSHQVESILIKLSKRKAPIKIDTSLLIRKIIDLVTKDKSFIEMAKDGIYYKARKGGAYTKEGTIILKKFSKKVLLILHNEELNFKSKNSKLRLVSSLINIVRDLYGEKLIDYQYVNDLLK